MSKIVLFNSPILFERNIDVFETTPKFIRLGIASLAGFLRKNGIDVKIIEPYTQSVADIEQIMRQYNPKYVGIPAFSNEIFNVSKTMEYVKSINPSIITIVGHSHITALPYETMQNFHSFDIGIIGEGELTLLDIVKGKNPDEIDGIIYRDVANLKTNPQRELIDDLSILGLPAFDLYDLREYKEKYSWYGGKVLNLPVESMRGCPFPCNFCFRIMGKTVRYKKPHLVADELEYYIENFPVKRVAFIEGTFGINKGLTLELCREITKRGINKKIRWNASVRANLDEEMVEAFAASGCRVLGLGVESGDDEVLKSCQKGITTEDIRNTVKLCKKYGIFVEAYFIFGLPGDTVQTIEKTIAFAKSLDIGGANFAILVPLPGTKIFEWAEKEEMGYKFGTRDFRFFGKQSGKALENNNISREELLKLQSKAYKHFYTSNYKRLLQFIYHLNTNRAKGVFKRLFLHTK